jgi:hypothetical protein
MFSRRVSGYSKASKRYCSTPTVSFDNAVCSPIYGGLWLINQFVRGILEALNMAY